MNNYYDQTVQTLATQLQQTLLNVDVLYKQQVQEIRLRINRPVSLVINAENYFVSSAGALSFTVPSKPLQVTAAILEQSYLSLTGYSVHSHQQELAKGFVTTKNGDRAGICGTAVTDNAGNMVYKDISSINLRVAREIIGCSEEIAKQLDVLAGVLIVGMPSSGKTTLLRDMVRYVSSNNGGKTTKVVLLDERMELAAMRSGAPSYDIGLCTDVICGQNKAIAIEQAIRTLSPNVIACDEIGSEQDLKELTSGLHAGVSFIATAHCGGYNDLYSNNKIQRLMRTGGFKQLVFLKTAIANLNYQIISYKQYSKAVGGYA